MALRYYVVCKYLSKNRVPFLSVVIIPALCLGIVWCLFHLKLVIVYCHLKSAFHPLSIIHLKYIISLLITCLFSILSVHCGLPGSHACGWGLLLWPFNLWPCCRSAASSWWCRNQPPLLHLVTHYWSHASEPFFRWPGIQHWLCSP